MERGKLIEMQKKSIIFSIINNLEPAKIASKIIKIEKEHPV